MAETNPSFESRFRALSQERGEYWFARDLMTLFGYQDWDAFKNIIHSAQRIAESVGYKHDNFHPVIRNVNGEAVEDFQVTRSGCSSIALNADRDIPAVAAAQDYFVSEVRYEFEDFIEYRD
ncbi:MAG TPA: BRO family protein [Bryobacteraceae bacterium]|nr:BRO family protein [Bryobacteraceae bacterium]